MIAAPKNLFRLFMVAPLPDAFFFDHPIGVARMSINHRAVPRTQRSAPFFTAWCAAEPGPSRTPLLGTVPALRSGIRMPHRVRDTATSKAPAMTLYRLLQERAAAGKPVHVALIGAGKFGSMFLSQVPHTPGLEVPVIVDLDPERARQACRTVGWEDVRIAATKFTDDGAAAASGNIEVIVEATGN